MRGGNFFLILMGHATFFLIDRKLYLNNNFPLFFFLTLKILQLFLYVNETEKIFIFLNAQKEIQTTVLFALVELPGGRISFGLESLFSPRKGKKNRRRKIKEICGTDLKQHKTNYFTTESFLSPLRDFPRTG